MNIFNTFVNFQIYILHIYILLTFLASISLSLLVVVVLLMLIVLFFFMKMLFEVVVV